MLNHLIVEKSGMFFVTAHNDSFSIRSDKTVENADRLISAYASFSGMASGNLQLLKSHKMDDFIIPGYAVHVSPDREGYLGIITNARSKVQHYFSIQAKDVDEALSAARSIFYEIFDGSVIARFAFKDNSVLEAVSESITFSPVYTKFNVKGSGKADFFKNMFESYAMENRTRQLNYFAAFVDPEEAVINVPLRRSASHKIQAGGIARVVEHLNNAVEGKGSVVIFTSYQKQGKGSTVDTEKNLKEYRDLGNVLNNLKNGAIALAGIWKGAAENSYLVPNLSLDLAKKLNAKYHQWAFIYAGPESNGEFQLWATPDINAGPEAYVVANTWNNYAIEGLKEPMGYSQLQGTDKKFSFYTGKDDPQEYMKALDELNKFANNIETAEVSFKDVKRPERIREKNTKLREMIAARDKNSDFMIRDEDRPNISPRFYKIWKMTSYKDKPEVLFDKISRQKWSQYIKDNNLRFVPEDTPTALTSGYFADKDGNAYFIGYPDQESPMGVTASYNSDTVYFYPAESGYKNFIPLEFGWGSGFYFCKDSNEAASLFGDFIPVTVSLKNPYDAALGIPDGAEKTAAFKSYSDAVKQSYPEDFVDIRDAWENNDNLSFIKSVLVELGFDGIFNIAISGSSNNWIVAFSRSSFTPVISFSSKHNAFANKAFWLTPGGRAIDVKINHIDAVIKDPDTYGYTSEEIKNIFKEFNEPMGLEGQAREKIMRDLLNKGWTRLRWRPKEFSWTAQVGSLSETIMDNLQLWASNMLKADSSYSTTDITIVPVTSGVPISHSLPDIANDVLYKTNAMENKMKKTTASVELDQIRKMVEKPGMLTPENREYILGYAVRLGTDAATAGKTGPESDKELTSLVEIVGGEKKLSEAIKGAWKSGYDLLTNSIVATASSKPSDLFIGHVSTGIAYADRRKEVQGDYKKIANLFYNNLELVVYDSKSDLLPLVKEHAAELQAMKGQSYSTTGSDQSVILGYDLPEVKKDLVDKKTTASVYPHSVEDSFVKKFKADLPDLYEGVKKSISAKRSMDNIHFAEQPIEDSFVGAVILNSYKLKLLDDYFSAADVEILTKYIDQTLPQLMETATSKKTTAANLPSFKVIFENGDSLVTSMASGVTLEDAKKYYIGKSFTFGTGERDNPERQVKAVSVEPVNSYDDDGSLPGFSVEDVVSYAGKEYVVREIKDGKINGVVFGTDNDTAVFTPDSDTVVLRKLGASAKFSERDLILTNISLVMSEKEDSDGIYPTNRVTSDGLDEYVEEAVLAGIPIKVFYSIPDTEYSRLAESLADDSFIPFVTRAVVDLVECDKQGISDSSIYAVLKKYGEVSVTASKKVIASDNIVRDSIKISDNGLEGDAFDAEMDKCPLPVDVFPNNMGINLCNIESISWEKLPDNQLISLTVHFLPDMSGKVQSKPKKVKAAMDEADLASIFSLAEAGYDFSVYLASGKVILRITSPDGDFDNIPVHTARDLASQIDSYVASRKITAAGRKTKAVEGFMPYTIDGVNYDIEYSGEIYSGGDERAPQEKIEVVKPSDVSDEKWDEIWEDVQEAVVKHIYSKEVKAMDGNKVNQVAVDSYKETLLWVEEEKLLKDYPDLDLNVHTSFSEEANKAIEADVTKFFTDNAADIEAFKEAEQTDDSFVAHSFILTRQGYGTGFVDFNSDAAKALDAASHKYPQLSVYAGEDGLIYFEGFETTSAKLDKYGDVPAGVKIEDGEKLTVYFDGTDRTSMEYADKVKKDLGDGVFIVNKPKAFFSTAAVLLIPADMFKVTSDGDFDYYAGSDPDGTMVYNIMTQGDPTPQGGYYSSDYISSQKKAPNLFIDFGDGPTSDPRM